MFYLEDRQVTKWLCSPVHVILDEPHAISMPLLHAFCSGRTIARYMFSN